MAVEEIRKSWPVSRVLSRTVIHLGRQSPNGSSNLPKSHAGHTSALLFDLAPSGVYPATAVASKRGALLPHHFTLTFYRSNRRYIFCGTFRRLTSPRRYLALYPAEPGLSSILSRIKQRLPSQLLPQLYNSKVDYHNYSFEECNILGDYAR